jgi:hypothetical protein
MSKEQQASTGASFSIRKILRTGLCAGLSLMVPSMVYLASTTNAMATPSPELESGGVSFEGVVMKSNITDVLETKRQELMSEMLKDSIGKDLGDFITIREHIRVEPPVDPNDPLMNATIGQYIRDTLTTGTLFSPSVLDKAGESPVEEVKEFNELTKVKNNYARLRLMRNRELTCSSETSEPLEHYLAEMVVEALKERRKEDLLSGTELVVGTAEEMLLRRAIVEVYAKASLSSAPEDLAIAEEIKDKLTNLKSTSTTAGALGTEISVRGDYLSQLADLSPKLLDRIVVHELSQSSLPQLSRFSLNGKRLVLTESVPVTHTLNFDASAVMANALLKLQEYNRDIRLLNPETPPQEVQRRATTDLQEGYPITLHDERRCRLKDLKKNRFDPDPATTKEVIGAYTALIDAGIAEEEANLRGRT